MYAFSTNYVDRDREQHRRPSHRFHRGYFITSLPRLMLWCRLFGHKPVVDGTGTYDPDKPKSAHRWVVCDRCGVRGEPQGSLDPAHYNEGDRYDGPWAPLLPSEKTARELADHLFELKKLDYFLPGPIPTRSHGGEKLGTALGSIGAEVVSGGQWTLFGFELKVGNCGSEHTLAAHLHLWPFGSLYLHTERFGTWLQRRLNPVGYQSRIIRAEIRQWQFSWRLWSERDGSRREPRWQNFDLRFNPLDRLLGPDRYSYEDVGGASTTGIVRMPESDYLVGLHLKQRTGGRRRGRKRTAWTVDWEALGNGIPTKGPLRGRITAAGVEVSARSVSKGTWPAEALAAIAARLTADRTSRGWSPVTVLPVDMQRLVVLNQQQQAEAPYEIAAQR